MAKVYYTGRELYHLASENGEYDGKIEVKQNGTTHVYRSKDSYWDDHSHDVYDKNGRNVYNRPEGEGHKWEDRFHD